MFDIGFIELLLIAVVGLLVLGPERLPVAIKTVALYIGRLKRAYHGVKADIEREIGADEIRQQLHNEEIMQTLESTKAQLKDIDQDIQATEAIEETASWYQDAEAALHRSDTEKTASVASAQTNSPSEQSKP